MCGRVPRRGRGSGSRVGCRGKILVRFRSLGGRRGRGETMTARDRFMELFLRHQDDLRAFLGAMVRDPHARADLFQDVALTLWNRIDTYDPDRPFGAWARGIAAKKVLQLRERSA